MSGSDGLQSAAITLLYEKRMMRGHHFAL